MLKDVGSCVLHQVSYGAVVFWEGLVLIGYAFGWTHLLYLQYPHQKIVLHAIPHDLSQI